MKYTAAVAKIPKYAVSTGGDSADIIERPLGGLSGLVVDGQGSGKPAKTISAALAGRAAGLISDGTRDGAVARAVHDWLYAQKHGRVSATISIISLATDTDTMVITRCGNCPVFVCSPTNRIIFSATSDPLGFYRFTRPQVDQLPLEPGLVAVTFSDGINNAGLRLGNSLDYSGWAEKIWALYSSGIDSAALAEAILKEALEMDDQRPSDDMTVLVMGILDAPADGIRRLHVEYPVE